MVSSYESFGAQKAGGLGALSFFRDGRRNQLIWSEFEAEAGERSGME